MGRQLIPVALLVLSAVVWFFHVSRRDGKSQQCNHKTEYYHNAVITDDDIVMIDAGQIAIVPARIGPDTFWLILKHEDNTDLIIIKGR